MKESEAELRLASVESDKGIDPMLLEAALDSVFAWMLRRHLREHPKLKRSFEV